MTRRTRSATPEPGGGRRGRRPARRTVATGRSPEPSPPHILRTTAPASRPEAAAASAPRADAPAPPSGADDLLVSEGENLGPRDGRGAALPASPRRAADPGQVVQAWSDMMERLSAVNMHFFAHWLRSMRPPGARHLDAMAFGQLGRVAGSRWVETVRGAADGAEGGDGEDERLRQLWGGMLAEYRRDLGALPPDAFVVDFEPLAEAWLKANSEAIDDASVRMVERFLEVMAIKARYGPEYYADPVLTEVGKSPREVVHEVEGAQLYRYLPLEGARKADAPPVLLIYSVINKPFILDLLPGYSFVEHLLGQGLDVYLVEWKPTKPGDRSTTLDSYIDPVVRSCIGAIRERTGASRVGLFGHCIGGVLAAMYAALHPADVDRLITLTTPFSAPAGGVVGLWTDRRVFPLESILDTYGHVPAKLIRYTFIGLKPYYEAVKWKTFLENLGNEDAMRLFYPIDRWANDNVDIPGEVFRKFIDEVYHEERLRRGLSRINGRRVDLRDITCPLMNLLATADWIVPPASAEILNDLVGSRDRRLVKIDGAHVAIMIDPRTRPVWTQMSDFLLGN